MKLHYSQTIRPKPWHKGRFTTLWNYIILKPRILVSSPFVCFTTLWNYIILKHKYEPAPGKKGFTTLWNYIILKQCNYHNKKGKSFTTLWNYIILKPQTAYIASRFLKLFYYLMKLHYSQTETVVKDDKGTVLLPYEITLFSNSPPNDWFYCLVLLPYEITLFSNLKPQINCDIISTE